MENSVIFSDPDLAEGAIKGIYTYYGEQNYRARYLPWYGMNTDIEWYNSSEKGDDKAHLVTFNALPNNTQMNIAESKEPWSNIYNGIEKANLAIQGLKASADLTNSKLKQLYGEALL
ncbi:outer membrane protein [Bacteroides reticulotermitis JCM 10512]|uniref:Outer membrane protein n=1 Tax=Bacteroides reticulotermitis JCM 10512 TaxID=1445607 RepID=W4USF2_9BACE|nr:outer membrane protein [Bacteroides reticulotermitis JCM 10512]